MPRQVTYSYARQNLAEILDDAGDAQEPVTITRRGGHADVAIIPASELRSPEETAHLLRSPKNARRLLASLQRALENSTKPQSIGKLNGELGLG